MVQGDEQKEQNIDESSRASIGLSGNVGHTMGPTLEPPVRPYDKYLENP